MNFSDLNLNSKLSRAIADQGFDAPTEIQAKAIPILLKEERDFVGQAQTGTGKTAAFVLPLLHRLETKASHIQALILAPTRELANQVHEEVEKLGKYLNIVSVPVYGGTPYDKQVHAIKRKRPHIIVGTPGRVMDLMRQGILQFGKTNFMILDEADEMLNMGFLEDVQFILDSFKNKKKLWMFSATMPEPILNLIQKDFHEPQIIKVKKKELSNQNIEQKYYLIKRKHQKEALRRLLDTEPEMYGIVFCQTKMDTRELAEELLLKGYNVETLHGEMGQAQRDHSMAKFKAKKARLMICTDVAARGIDVNNLTHVVNYGLPRDMESYVHRIGRTGRAGLKGIAISLVDPSEKYKIKKLESFIKQRIDLSKLPSLESLKYAHVSKELNNMAGIVEAVREKGDDFKLDQTFEVFSKALKGLSPEELKKVLFTWGLNSTLRHYESLGSLDANPNKEARQGSRYSGRVARNGRRPSRNRTQGKRKFSGKSGGRGKRQAQYSS